MHHDFHPRTVVWSITENLEMGFTKLCSVGRCIEGFGKWASSLTNMGTASAKEIRSTCNGIPWNSGIAQIDFDSTEAPQI